MRLGFDLRPFLREETGVGVYLRNLLTHLAFLDRENEYFLLSSSFKDRFPREKIPPFQGFHFRDLRIPVRLLNFFWYQFAWPPFDAFFSRRLDLTHSPTPLLLPGRGKMVVTVHDLFHLDHPELAEAEAGRLFPRRTAQSLIRAHGIVTFSFFMRQDILRRIPLDGAKIKVIPHGLDPFFLEPVPPEELESVRRRWQLPASFLLFVGTLEPRKNLPRLIMAMKILQEDNISIPVLLVGKRGGDEKKLRQMVSSLGLEEKVFFVGYVCREDLRAFYHLATALVLPSICEGFGFPMLEAMACGLPVVASRAAALPEVGGEAAIYFNPEDPEDIAHSIAHLLRDPSLSEELGRRGRERAREFSWEKAARETLAFYHQILGA